MEVHTVSLGEAAAEERTGWRLEARRGGRCQPSVGSVRGRHPISESLETLAWERMVLIFSL